MSNWYPAGGAGNIGDMTKAVYDAQGLVETAGGIPDFVKAKLDELKLDLGSIASIKVVDTQPTNPVRNTLYYIGTANPYQVELYANGEWYDMGTTDADLTDYAKTVDVDAALELKQDKLTTAQLDVVNSGITVAKVETYDGYAAGKADVGLDNVTNAVFKDKVENCGLALPAFEYRDCTVSNKLSSVAITNGKQCKLSDKLYYIVFNMNTTGSVSSGETRICRITSLPSLTAASSVTPISVIWNGSWNPISAFISSGNDLYIRSNNSLPSNFTLSFAGLVMYK